MICMRWIGHALLVLATLLVTLPSRAQDSAAAAEVLFQEGRALYEQGRYAEACPKLAESHRLDPATGTLLTLALCREGEGKLASAWTAFVDVQGRARREGREDRERIATQRAAAIRPRLSTLTVDVPANVASTPGLEVRVDGTLLGSASFGVAMPMDGGEHRIEAAAAGKVPWRTVVQLEKESDAVRTTLPPLSDAPRTASANAEPPKSSEVRESAVTPSEPSKGGSGMRTAAIVVASAGAVALGVGGYLALDAKSDYSAARERCDGLECEQGPYDDVKRAQKQGNIATVVMSVGGAALVTGGVLWFVAPRGSARAASAGPRLERVRVGAQGVEFLGTF
jgi:hypothetical protein